MSSDPKRTLILFAHGAGASSSSPWMQSWAKRLGTLGKVLPFDYPYMEAGRKAPDRLPKLIEAHRAQLVAARKRFRQRSRIVLCGKSMGSRVGCHLTLSEPVTAVVCLGYPLRGIGKTAQVRDEVLRAMTAPVLFVQGTRDRLCPLDLLEEVRPQMQVESALHVVEDGDHSLEVAKRRLKAEGLTQDDVDAESLAAIAAFLDAV